MIKNAKAKKATHQENNKENKFYVEKICIKYQQVVEKQRFIKNSFRLDGTLLISIRQLRPQSDARSQLLALLADAQEPVATRASAGQKRLVRLEPVHAVGPLVPAAIRRGGRSKVRPKAQRHTSAQHNSHRQQNKIDERRPAATTIRFEQTRLRNVRHDERGRNQHIAPLSPRFVAIFKDVSGALEFFLEVRKVKLGVGRGKRVGLRFLFRKTAQPNKHCQSTCVEAPATPISSTTEGPLLVHCDSS